jgi:hypothetical protein
MLSVPSCLALPIGSYLQQKKKKLVVIETFCKDTTGTSDDGLCSSSDQNLVVCVQQFSCDLTCPFLFNNLTSSSGATVFLLEGNSA